MNVRKYGFDPVFNRESQVLILGSFPSVKSRETDFYYGHKQNRFWKMISGYFNEDIPQTVEEKRTFLLRRKIALWDIVQSCEIVNSDDSTIKNAELADLNKVFQSSNVRGILLNGETAYKLFLKGYKWIKIPYFKMQSTSPRNRLYKEENWWKALDELFGMDRRTEK